MSTSVAVVSLTIIVLGFFQIFVGKTFASGRASVSRSTDPASFWGSLLNQCVAIAVTAAVTVGLANVDWAKVSKSMAPRRSG